MVARMRAVPGRRYAVTARHTERFPYHRLGGGDRLRRFLGSLGLTATEIRRSVANIGEAASLWGVQSGPEGGEGLRYYWTSQRPSHTAACPAAVRANRAVPAWRPRKAALAAVGLVLEAQIAPSIATVAAIGRARLPSLVSPDVFQAIPPGPPAATPLVHTMPASLSVPP